MLGSEQEVSQRLSRISTCWSLVFHAHHGSLGGMTEAQTALLQCYSGAIYRYLLTNLRDPDAAEEVAQEFAHYLVRGDFRQADPQRGRFRDYLRTVLFHLVVNYRRERDKRARVSPLPSGPAEPGVLDPPGAEAEQEFIRLWREELLQRTWEALAALDKPMGPEYYAVLRLRVEQPDLASGGMAEQLTATLGREVTAEGVRQTLHRARLKFADLLIDEVVRTLGTESAERLEEEVIDLGLLTYCRQALQRRTEGKSV